MNIKELYNWALNNGWKGNDDSPFLQSKNHAIILGGDVFFISNDYPMGHHLAQDKAIRWLETFDVDEVNKVIVANGVLAIKYEN